MSESKHTPGPWKASMLGGGKQSHPNDYSIRVDCPDSSDGKFKIATVIGKPDGAGSANARLIAAAPELLAFVQSIVNTVFIVPDEPRLLNWKEAYKARAAEAAILIAKAEGAHAGEELAK